MTADSIMAAQNASPSYSDVVCHQHTTSESNLDANHVSTKRGFLGVHGDRGLYTLYIVKNTVYIN